LCCRGFCNFALSPEASTSLYLSILTSSGNKCLPVIAFFSPFLHPALEQL
jgi:hypothetical protein